MSSWCKGGGEVMGGGERARDGGMDGWMEEGVEERKGTGKTGVEGSSL